MFIIAILILGLLVSLSSYSVFRQIGSSGNSILDQFLSRGSTINNIDPDFEIPEFGSKNPSLPVGEPWDGNNRVTMLIMGLDYRDWISGNDASRTDTLILITIDPVTKTAGILSVPRDLWVNVPGFAPAKINTAYYYGVAFNVPGGGPGLAIKTVEATIGVPIDYYAQVDFGAFERFIELIHGVKINVKEPIRVDTLGNDKPPIFLKPGIQTLPGDLALAYARTRNVDGGDFARSERQQQVILAIRDRLLNPAIFSTLIENAPELYNELSSGIDTNLPLSDAIKLAFLAIQVRDTDIVRGVINEKYVTFGESPDGLAILIPVPDKIRLLRDEIFPTSGAFSPLTPGDSLAQMLAENARVSVQNGTSSGTIGDRTTQYLQDLGVNVVEVTQAGEFYPQTTIEIYYGRPFALKYFADLFRVQTQQIILIFEPNSSIDIAIKLGSDWLNNNPIP